MALTPAEIAARDRLAALTPASFDTNNGYETAFPQANNDTSLLAAAVAREAAAAVLAGEISAAAVETTLQNSVASKTAADRSDRSSTSARTYSEAAQALALAFDVDVASRSRIPPARDWKFGPDVAPADLTYSRNSPAFRTGRFNLLETVPANTIRIAFGGSGSWQGALVEPQRTNLLSFSSALDQSVYSKFRATVAANVAVSPDGTASADKLIEDTTANATHFFLRTVTVQPSADYVYSCFFKAAGRNRVSFQVSAGTPSPIGITLSLDTETFTGGPAGTSVTRFANGWYRLRVPIRTSAGASSLTYLAALVGGVTNSVNYTGDGVSGMLLWGQQFELGLRGTSLIETGAQTVTRPTDTVSATLGSWFNPSEGSILIEYSVDRPRSDDGSQDRLIEISGETSDNSIAIRLGDSIGGADLFVRSEGVTVVDTASASVAAGTVSRSAVSWASNHFIFGHQGSIVADLRSGLVPQNLTILRLASGLSGGSSFIQVRRVLYWPRALSAADVISTTKPFAGDDSNA